MSTAALAQTMAAVLLACSHAAVGAAGCLLRGDGCRAVRADPALQAVPLPPPCSNDVPWCFSKCDFDDFSGWSDAADAELAARGVQLDRYLYRVYLLPPSACPFVGLGYTGCDGSFPCRAWIGGDFWTAPEVGKKGCRVLALAGDPPSRAAHTALHLPGLTLLGWHVSPVSFRPFSTNWATTSTWGTPGR